MWLGFVAQICNPSTQEVKAGAEVLGQCGLHNENLSCRKKGKKRGSPVYLINSKV
jgi:hypothetical protein